MEGLSKVTKGSNIFCNQSKNVSFSWNVGTKVFQVSHYPCMLMNLEEKASQSTLVKFSFWIGPVLKFLVLKQRLQVNKSDAPLCWKKKLTDFGGWYLAENPTNTALIFMMYLIWASTAFKNHNGFGQIFWLWIKTGKHDVHVTFASTGFQLSLPFRPDVI